MGKTLSHRDASVLYQAQFEADLAVTELAKALKLPSHVVHYTLHQMRKDNVIRPWALLDYQRLGFEQYRIFFSLAADKRPQREKILGAMKEDGRVVWWATLSGSFQYAIAMYVRSGTECADFLESIAERFGSVFLKKALILDTMFTVFRKKYLVPAEQRKSKDSITMTKGRPKITLDTLDYKIISALSRRELSSQRDLARYLGAPRATIDQRLRALRAEGVILRSVYHVSAARLGYLVYRVLIYGRGIQRGFRERISDFSLRHPNVVNLSSCLGPWDYELTIEIARAADSAQVVEDLFGELGSAISDVELLQVLEQSASNNLNLSDRL